MITGKEGINLCNGRNSSEDVSFALPNFNFYDEDDDPLLGGF